MSFDKKTKDFDWYNTVFLGDYIQKQTSYNYLTCPGFRGHSLYNFPFKFTLQN